MPWKMQVAMAPLDADKETIRRNLILFREQSGLSRSSLSILSGIPEKNIVRYEAGDTGISGAAVAAFARVFGRDPGDFHKHPPPPPPRKEDLPSLFLSQRPDSEVPEEILREARAAIDRLNDEIRGKKKGKK